VEQPYCWLGSVAQALELCYRMRPNSRTTKDTKAHKGTGALGFLCDPLVSFVLILQNPARRDISLDQPDPGIACGLSEIAVHCSQWQAFPQG